MEDGTRGILQDLTHHRTATPKASAADSKKDSKSASPRQQHDEDERPSARPESRPKVKEQQISSSRPAGLKSKPQPKSHFDDDEDEDSEDNDAPVRPKPSSHDLPSTPVMSERPGSTQRTGFSPVKQGATKLIVSTTSKDHHDDENDDYDDEVDEDDNVATKTYKHGQPQPQQPAKRPGSPIRQSLSVLQHSLAPLSHKEADDSEVEEKPKPQRPGSPIRHALSMSSTSSINRKEPSRPAQHGDDDEDDDHIPPKPSSPIRHTLSMSRPSAISTAQKEPSPRKPLYDSSEDEKVVAKSTTSKNKKSEDEESFPVKHRVEGSKPTKQVARPQRDEANSIRKPTSAMDKITPSQEPLSRPATGSSSFTVSSSDLRMGSSGKRPSADVLLARINNSPKVMESNRPSSPTKASAPKPAGSSPTSAPPTHKASPLVAKKPSPTLQPDRIAQEPHRVTPKPSLSHKSSTGSLSKLDPLASHHGSGILKPSASGPGDLDLVTSMAARLNKLEAEIRLLRGDIQTKNVTIQKLENEIELFSHHQGEANDHEQNAKIEFLEAKSRKLQGQVDEMESFLARYDMIWEDASTRPGSVGTSRQSSRPVSAASSLLSVSSRVGPVEFPYEMDRIRARVTELNVLAGEGVAYVQSGRAGASLKMQAALPLSLYRNGFALRSGPFRPFSDKSTKMFMRDLLDGYFPFELKDQYPDGVPFDLRDYHTTAYDDQPKYIPFSGQGHIVGYAGEPTSRPTSSKTIHSTTTVSKPNPAVTHFTSHEEDASSSQSRLWNPEASVGGQYSWLKSEHDRHDSSLNLHPVERHARFREDTPPAHDSSLSCLNDSPLKKQSKENFLQQIPKCVIKNGQIVNVREGINSFLDGRSESSSSLLPPTSASAAHVSEATRHDPKHDPKHPPIIKTVVIPTTVDMADRHSTRRSHSVLSPHPPVSRPSSRPASPIRKAAGSQDHLQNHVEHVTPYDQITTLKIHAPDDCTEYFVRMYAKQTIKELRNMLDEHILKIYGEYSLKPSFPQKKPFDPQMTLEECGLVPNAKLYICHRHK
ncbi:hypothetical protein SmJEL517_g02697 [Synchytrium microbalum]|uniref:UBX domain-containing protein 11 n=1 Tax=Synchytrium microbalum TaxID=1806994 RepID=A0A507CB05_9FUNG|nr:uncharacterized protein SmJEL517_g02697 [Synchytrium microbalum]TPX34715.1 hypothetical protein SmJEL517_g02697 [Synchytrium microbalum]